MTRPTITDHALLRYLERVKGVEFVARARRAGFNDHQVLKQLKADGIDIEGIRASLLTPQVRVAIAMGARSVVFGAHRFIIRGDVVVTTAPVLVKGHTTRHRHLKPILRKGQARGLREERERPVLSELLME